MATKQVHREGGFLFLLRSAAFLWCLFHKTFFALVPTQLFRVPVVTPHHAVELWGMNVTARVTTPLMRGSGGKQTSAAAAAA